MHTKEDIVDVMRLKDIYCLGVSILELLNFKTEPNEKGIDFSY